jgi:diaminohydroxyphosphoribosylaminopyrimidine deaminase / 5-amino-6-(5-phosphoribosylamino)uracil reductase
LASSAKREGTVPKYNHPSMHHHPHDGDRAWRLILAAAAAADLVSGDQTPALAGDAAAAVAWRAGSGWRCLFPADDPQRPLLDLYLPFCSATAARPLTLGHLGESLDGFIATHAGESQWVTGPENVLHMHRLRALSHAVVVGAGTVAVDDPQLTTRLVSGPNPLRVVLDPGRRLSERHRVFNDDDAETLCVCAAELVRPGEERLGAARILGIAGTAEGIDIHELVRLLRARQCHRIFVEGGGVTVSMFLQANLLDRLHLAIAPLLIGNGRAAIRLPAPAALDDCHRPAYRVFRMGGDVLFDCDLRTPHVESSGGAPAIGRII